MVLIDQEKARTTCGSEVVTPTFERMNKFSKDKIASDLDEDLIDEVFTAEYQDKYTGLFNDAKAQGYDLWLSRDFNDFASQLPPDEQDAFATRFKLHSRLGANEDFLGTGLTKNTLPGMEDRCGAVETFTYDKAPMNLDELQNTHGVVKVIDLNEINAVEIA